MRRLFVAAVLGLALAGTATAVVPTTVLPKPAFPPPATRPGSGSVHFQVVSSTPIDPAQLITAPKPHGSPALAASADNFALLNRTIVSGYGFTAEPDYDHRLVVKVNGV